MREGRKCGSNWDCYCFLCGKKILKSFDQCHLFAHSPPDRRPNNKYPVKHFVTLLICVKMFHSQYYLVATVIHVRSVRSQIRVCVRIYIYIYRVSQELRLILRDLIPELMLSQTHHIHVGPIRKVSEVMSF